MPVISKEKSTDILAFCSVRGQGLTNIHEHKLPQINNEFSRIIASAVILLTQNKCVAVGLRLFCD
jgi:hypothetical protein